MGHTYRGAKSECKLVTEFDSYSYDGVSASIWVIPTGAKSVSYWVRRKARRSQLDLATV